MSKKNPFSSSYKIAKTFSGGEEREIEKDWKTLGGGGFDGCGLFLPLLSLSLSLMEKKKRKLVRYGKRP